MRMWLYALMPALAVIASVVNGEPNPLFCFDFETNYNGTHTLIMNDRVTVVYPEYGEACYFKIAYVREDDGNCGPIHFVSGVVPEVEMHGQPMDPHIAQYVLQCSDRDFCSANFTGMEQYMREKLSVNDECLLSVVRELPKAWPGIVSHVLDLSKYTKDQLLYEQEEHVFLNNGSRYFVDRYSDSKCFDLYQDVDEPFEERSVGKVVKDRDICSLNIRFDAYLCRPVRIFLSRGHSRKSYRFVKDKDREDTFKFGTWCQGDYCNRNLSYLAETIHLYYVRNNLTGCALRAVEKAIELYNDPLENVYQKHMSLPQEEQMRIEKSDSKQDNSNKRDQDSIRKPKPLIERFQPVNQELLRESDYHIQMLKKSHMWIQYTILTYTTLAIFISVTYGIRKKMQEEAIYVNRGNL